jgi:type I restriction enzyme R subunit
MKFTEESLEKAVIELFGEVNIPHVHGQLIHRVPEDVLFQEDLRNYLIARYSNENISSSEIDSILEPLSLYLLHLCMKVTGNLWEWLQMDSTW